MGFVHLVVAYWPLPTLVLLGWVVSLIRGHGRAGWYPAAAAAGCLLTVVVGVWLLATRPPAPGTPDLSFDGAGYVLALNGISGLITCLLPVTGAVVLRVWSRTSHRP
jgi:hypothetical protein